MPVSDINNLFPSKTKLAQFCQEAGITYLGLFGSQARGEARENSDVDLLVDYKQPKSLFELGGLIAELEDMLGKEVDLVKRHNIKPLLRPYIDKDVITLYEKNE